MRLKDLSLDIYDYLFAFIWAVGQVMTYCQG